MAIGGRLDDDIFISWAMLESQYQDYGPDLERSVVRYKAFNEARLPPRPKLSELRLPKAFWTKADVVPQNVLVAVDGVSVPKPARFQRASRGRGRLRNLPTQTERRPGSGSGRSGSQQSDPAVDESRKSDSPREGAAYIRNSSEKSGNSQENQSQHNGRSYSVFREANSVDDHSVDDSAPSAGGAVFKVPDIPPFAQNQNTSQSLHEDRPSLDDSTRFSLSRSNSVSSSIGDFIEEGDHLDIAPGDEDEFGIADYSEVGCKRVSTPELGFFPDGDPQNSGANDEYSAIENEADNFDCVQESAEGQMETVGPSWAGWPRDYVPDPNPQPTAHHFPEQNHAEAAELEFEKPCWTPNNVLAIGDTSRPDHPFLGGGDSSFKYTGTLQPGYVVQDYMYDRSRKGAKLGDVLAGQIKVAKKSKQKKKLKLVNSQGQDVEKPEPTPEPKLAQPDRSYSEVTAFSNIVSEVERQRTGTPTAPPRLVPVSPTPETPRYDILVEGLRKDKVSPTTLKDIFETCGDVASVKISPSSTKSTACARISYFEEAKRDWALEMFDDNDIGNGLGTVRVKKT